MKLRKEFDSIGSINVPNDKYWGASTQRSNKFFNIGKILVNISIIKSIAIIKRSAAIVHARDKLIDNRGKGSSIGFGAKVKNQKEQSLSEIMKKLEPEDLIKYGLIPEFIGRMPIIATLNDLDEKSLVKILKEPKNSLIKQYQRLFEFEEVELEFKDEAILEIAKKAISKKTGARGLRSILENILLKTMFELPDMENVIKVTVDNAAVQGKSEPIVTYGKKPSTSVA